MYEKSLTAPHSLLSPLTGYESLNSLYQTSVCPLPDLTIAAPTLARGLEQSVKTDMVFTGTLADVLADLDASVANKDYPLLVFSAGRILRGLIDAKIAAPGEALDHDFEEMSAAARFMLGLFAANDDQRSHINQLRGNPVSPDLPKIPVAQTADAITFSSTTPDAIGKAALQLDAVVHGDDILFISLCHGGLVAGAGTFLLREYNRQNGNSYFYPIRFSTHKCKDKVPQLSLDESRMLVEQSEGRSVVVFDEDASAGNTIEAATDYFKAMFGKEVVPIVANDLRRNRAYDKNEPGNAYYSIPKIDSDQTFFSNTSKKPNILEQYINQL